MALETAKERAFVACPFNLLKERFMGRLLSEGINPEVGLNGSIMADYRLHDFFSVAERLKGAGRRCSIHAPFIDIFPGAFDPVIRQVCASRIKDAIDLAVLFGAEHVVIHTGFEPTMFGEVRDQWLVNFLSSLRLILAHAEASGVRIMLENVFEKDTSIHERIFSEIGSDTLGFCLDIGHVMAFSDTPLEQWLEAVGTRIGHLHLHDNRGGADEHLAIGEGDGAFELLFSWLHERDMHPVITIEAHDEAKVIPSLSALEQLLSRYPV